METELSGGESHPLFPALCADKQESSFSVVLRKLRGGGVACSGGGGEEGQEEPARRGLLQASVGGLSLRLFLVAGALLLPAGLRWEEL